MLSVVLLGALTWRRIVLAAVCAALVFAGLSLEEEARRELRDRFDSAERGGALLLRISGDETLTANDCARVGRLDGVTAAYLRNDDRTTQIVYVTGDVTSLYSVPVGWAAMTPQVLDDRLSASHGRFGQIDIVEPDDTRLPELQTSVTYRAGTAEDGGACVAGTSWARQRDLRELVAGVLPAGNLNVTSVRANTLMDERDRFNDNAPSRSPLVFAAFAGLLAGFSAVARRRYVALLLSVGMPRRTAVGAVALPVAVDAAVAATLGVCAFALTYGFGAAQLEVGSATVAAVYVVVIAAWAAVAAAGLVVFGNYARYLRTDD